MKILKVFGIVAGIHMFALILIFSNPGCSSTAKPAPAPSDTMTRPDPTPTPAPTVGLPGSGASPDGAPISPAPGGSPIAAAPSAPDSSAPTIAAGLFSPTRPGTPAAAALEAQPVEGVTPATTYVVGKGDSLWTIAKKNKLKISDLAAANGLKAGSTLRPGQKLIIPGGSPASTFAKASADVSAAPAGARASAGSAKAAAVVAPPASSEGVKHVVKPGETLGTIARMYGVKVGDLATKNNISDPKLIHPGQVLVIPAGGHAVAGKSAKPASAAVAASSSASVPSSATGSGPSFVPPGETPAGPAAPGPDQDLDAGLKPGAAGDVPVIKIDDSPKQP